MELANTSDENLQPDDPALIARRVDAAVQALAVDNIRSRRDLTRELNGIYGLTGTDSIWVAMTCTF